MKFKSILTTLVVGLLGANLHAVEVANAASDYQTAQGIVAGTTAPIQPPEGWTYLASTAATGGTEVALTPQTGIGNAGNQGFAIESGIDLGGGPLFVGVLGSIAGGTEFEILTDGLEGNGRTDGGASPGNSGVVGTDLLISPGESEQTAFIIMRYTISAADIANGTFATLQGNFRDLTGRPDRGGPAESITADIFLNETSVFAVTGGAAAQGTSSFLEETTGTFGVFDLVVEAGDTISFVVGNNGSIAGDESALAATIDLDTAAANVAPTITVDPMDQDIFVGDPLTLSVTVSGSVPFSFQWRKDGVNIDDGTGNDIIFNIPSVDADDAANYDCFVTNGNGEDTSLASVVTVSNAPLQIVTQPIAQNLLVGETLTLSVEVTGTGPISYFWAIRDENNDPVEIDPDDNPTAAQPTLIIDPVSLSDAGSYDVFIVGPDDQELESALVIITVTDGNSAPTSTAQDPQLVSTTVNRQIIFEDLAGDFITDPDGNELVLSLPSATSANGAAITTNGTRVAYLPSPDSTVTGDTFSVAFTDPLGESVSINFSVDVLADAAGAPVVIADAALDYVQEAGPFTAPAAPPAGWRYYQIEQNALDDVAFNLAADGTNLAAQSTSGNVGNLGFEGANNGNILGTQTNPDTLFQVFDDGFNGDGNGALGNQSLIGADLLMVPPSTSPDPDNPDATIFSSVVASYTISSDDTANGSIATISGSFREQAGEGPDSARANQLGSVTVSLYINNEEVFTVSGDMGQLLQSDGVFSFTTPSAVAIGDVISFVVDRQGTSDNMSNGGDEVALNARIELSGDPIIPTGEIVIDSCDFVEGGFQVVVSGLTSGVDYILQRSDDLEDGFPTPVGDTVSGTGTGDTFTDPNPPTGADARAFYQVFEIPGT